MSDVKTTPEAAKPAIVKPEPTSEKLTAIRAEIDAKLGIDQSKLDRKGKLDLNLEIYKLGNDERVEIANIEKAEREAKAMEARNAKISMIDELLAAHVANNTAIGDKKMSIEDKNAVNNKFHKLRETVVNAVLGSKPIAAVSGDKPAGTKGATGQEIVDLYDKYRAEGKTDKEARDAIKAAGHSRGTTDAVILAAKGPVDKR